jgi:UTP--glucose-1-phosphate uridylyltransferase
MFGDDLTVEPKPGRFLSKMIITFEKYQAAVVIAVKDVGKEEISRYGSAKYMEDVNYPNRISAMLEKLPADQAPSTMAQGGRFVVSTSKIFPVLEKQGLSRDNELWFADANNSLAQSDVVLTQAFEGEEDWMTTGDPLRWLQANIAVALKNPAFHDDLIKFLKTINS